ncbi:MAG: histone deacetylase [Pirellulaceae bacterium]
MPRIVYSRRYNIGFFGLERLHPFDSRKYGRAWRVLRERFGRRLDEMWIRPERPASREELLLVHSEEYLHQLRHSKYVARALEVPSVAVLPAWTVDRCVLRPMRFAVRGTIMAARASLDHGLAVNLSGGYHHAKPESGEGFSIYSDIGIAIAALRRDGLLSDDARVAYIDLDAHQGNGVCRVFERDSRVFIFDMYNALIYPLEIATRQRIDCDIPLFSACGDEEYLGKLQSRLPGFLDSAGRTRPIGLAIFNAGTDILLDDPLGCMNVSAAAILERDLYVVKQLRHRDIPTVMVLSGGYTRQSYQLVANSVSRLLESPREN